MDTEFTKFHHVINFVSSHVWCIGQVCLFCTLVLLDLRFKVSSSYVGWYFGVQYSGGVGKFL